MRSPLAFHNQVLSNCGCLPPRFPALPDWMLTAATVGSAVLGVAAAVAMGLVSCGGVTTEPPSPASVFDAGPDVKLIPYAPKQDAAIDRAVWDAGQDTRLPEFQEDACPPASPPPPEIHCDPLGTGECPSGTACFPFPPQGHDPCHPGPYVMECAQAGRGTQGMACGDGSWCEGGHVCAVTGRGTQCLRLCRPGSIGVCPEGMVCGRLDIPELGGCI
jgi:hypothetical protein